MTGLKPIRPICYGIGVVVLASWMGWLAGPRVRGLLETTALVALPSALLAALVGVPIAILIAKTRAPGRRFAVVFFSALLLLPLHAVTAGWLAAFGYRGWVTDLLPGEGVARAWLDGFSGAIAIHAIAGIPWVVLMSVATLRAVDPRREEQALLDAPATRVLWGVTLREAWPGLLAAAGWVAVLASTEIAVTDLFRVRTFAEEVYTQAALGALTLPMPAPVANQTQDLAPPPGIIGFMAGVGLICLAGLAVFLVLTDRVRRAIQSAAESRLTLTRIRWPLTILLGIAMLILVGFPVGSLGYQAGLVTEVVDSRAQTSWSASKLVAEIALAPWRNRRELSVSAGLGVAVASASVLIGAAIAWRLRRGGAVAAGLLLGLAITLATPGPLIGIATIQLLNQPLDSPVAWLGELYGTWFAPWLVQCLRVTPYIALFLWPAAASLHESVLAAARSDGAGPWRRALLVAAPMRLPALVAAWVTAFALSIGELSATALVTPPGTPPLSVRLLSLLHYGVEDRVAAICLALMIAFVASASSLVWLMHRQAVASTPPDRLN